MFRSSAPFLPPASHHRRRPSSLRAPLRCSFLETQDRPQPSFPLPQPSALQKSAISRKRLIRLMRRALPGDSSRGAFLPVDSFSNVCGSLGCVSRRWAKMGKAEQFCRRLPSLAKSSAILRGTLFERRFFPIASLRRCAFLPAAPQELPALSSRTSLTQTRTCARTGRSNDRLCRMDLIYFAAHQKQAFLGFLTSAFWNPSSLRISNGIQH